jgi:hypothetical protein
MLFVALACLAAPALAQDDGGFRFGGDLFASGGTVTIDAGGLDDVFAAGERVEVAAPITGSAHLAGRRVVSAADVPGTLYGFGQDVSVTAPVGGDAVLAGYDVAVDAAVGGDLRAAGQKLRVAGPVAGSALLAAGTVSLDAAIAGDAAIGADTLDFGPAARVDGRLMLYGEDAADIAVPDSVAPADRIERYPGEHRPTAGPFPERGPSWFALATRFVVGVLVLALLAFLAALVAPRGVEGLGERIAHRPLRTFGIGFLTLATLIGACVLAVLTIIGALAVPVILLATAILCFIGYVVAVYLAGRAVWSWADQLPPDTVPERALVALIGAAVVSIVALVPFLGWPLSLVLTLTGVGAITVAWLRPEFRA